MRPVQPCADCWPIVVRATGDTFAFSAIKAPSRVSAPAAWRRCEACLRWQHGAVPGAQFVLDHENDERAATPGPDPRRAVCRPTDEIHPDSIWCPTSGRRRSHRADSPQPRARCESVGGRVHCLDPTDDFPLRPGYSAIAGGPQRLPDTATACRRADWCWGHDTSGPTRLRCLRREPFAGGERDSSARRDVWSKESEAASGKPAWAWGQ